MELELELEESVLGKRPRTRSDDHHSEPDENELKRKKICEEIEASLPEGLSKNQRKKQIKEKLRERLKPEWK